MMINIFIKHWLYEKCINIIFDNIFINFIADPLDIREKELEKYLRGGVDFVKNDTILPDGTLNRVMTIDPNYSKALHELKDIQIKKGTFNPIPLPTRDKIRGALQTSTMIDDKW